MKILRAMVFLVPVCLLYGCAQNPRPTPEAGSLVSIDQAKAVALAKVLVVQKEKWSHVDCEAQRIDRGWKVFVCPTPIKIVGPQVLLTLDDSGRLMSYEKWYNQE
jgi:hypothetical protein